MAAAEVARNPDSPYGGAAAVAPNDGADLAVKPTRGLFIGGAGNLKVTMEDGSTPTFTGVVAGSVLRLKVVRVWATGTTATNILGLY